MKFCDIKKDTAFFFSNEFWQLFIEFTDEDINLLATEATNLPRKGIILRLAIFGFGFIRSLAYRLSGEKPEFSMDDEKPLVVIVSGSDNEYRSTRFLEDTGDLNVLYCGTKTTNGSPPLLAYFSGVFFLPFLLLQFFVSSPEKRVLYKYLADQFLLVMGWRIVQRKLYRDRKIKTLVYSNHMSPVSRSAIMQAKEHCDATIIYVEHTPILGYWPEIDADVYFLSGRFSFDNMVKKTLLNNKKVYLLGSPKNDLIKFRREGGEISNIGLCVSTADDLAIVKTLIDAILSYNESVKVLVRPHPSFRDFNNKLGISHPRLVMRAATSESVHDYLSSSDCLIVNDSGIFFEGLLAGIDVYRIRMTRMPSNNYGVPARFSQIYDKSPAEIVATIFSDDSVTVGREKLNYFFGNISTQFEGNASKVVSELISTYTYNGARGRSIQSPLATSLSEVKKGSSTVFSLYIS